MLESTNFSTLIAKKISESQNEIDKMEFLAIHSIHNKQYDDLFKLFGFDKVKLSYEVEKYLGKKIAKP